MKLAISGKGGVGKTTLAGLLARLYASEGRPVLAVDADPDSNLASAVGVAPEKLANLKPIVEMADLIEERTGMRPGTVGGYYTLNPRVDDLPDTLSVTHEGVRLLVMGTVKRGGGGCVCPENVLLKSLMRHLVVHRSDVVIMDMVAGVEHLGRGTAESVDALVVVVEPGMRSVQTARAVQRLAGDLGIKQTFVVGNKVRNDEDRAFISANVGDLPVAGYISYRESIVRADLEGRSVFDLDPVVVDEARAIRENLERLLIQEAEKAR